MTKPLATLLTLVAGTFLVQAQGTISIANTVGPYLIETNANAYWLPGQSIPATGSPTARMTTVPGQFYFSVLTSPPGPMPSANPFAGAWLETGVYGFNSRVTRGGITSPASSVADNWPAPTGPSYSSGSDNWYLIVGWSASFGSTWAQVKQNYFVMDGLMGQSPVAHQVAGGVFDTGLPPLPAVSLFGNGTGIASAGLSAGFALGGHALPEPNVFALTALGAVAMWLRGGRNNSPL